VTELDRSILRGLAAWNPEGIPVTSLYLTIDGRRYPRRADYEVRLDELLRDAKAQMDGLSAEAARSVGRDLERMSGFVREDLERGDTRGLALFSADAAGLWEAILLPRTVLDRAYVAPRAEIRMLEALLETYGATCTALVDFEKARLFLLQLGRVEEVHDVWDEVPGRHEQGGRAQMRMQRHVDDHRQQHLKHVAQTLFGLLRDRGFDHLILAGPGEAHHELERCLHGYLRQRLRARITLPMSASGEEVRARTLEAEEGREREAERGAVARLREAGATGAGVTGLGDTLAALGDGRVGELVVRVDLSAPGARCGACGRLATGVRECPTCGAQMEDVRDVVEVAVAHAYGQGCQVETIVEDEQLVALGGIGALLRY
jgi:peptide chain release factor subunit 1